MSSCFHLLSPPFPIPPSPKMKELIRFRVNYADFFSFHYDSFERKKNERWENENSIRCVSESFTVENQLLEKKIWLLLTLHFYSQKFVYSCKNLFMQENTKINKRSWLFYFKLSKRNEEIWLTVKREEKNQDKSKKKIATQLCRKICNFPTGLFPEQKCLIIPIFFIKWK